VEWVGRVRIWRHARKSVSLGVSLDCSVYQVERERTTRSAQYFREMDDRERSGESDERASEWGARAANALSDWKIAKANLAAAVAVYHSALATKKRGESEHKVALQALATFHKGRSATRAGAAALRSRAASARAVAEEHRAKAALKAEEAQVAAEARAAWARAHEAVPAEQRQASAQPKRGAGRGAPGRGAATQPRRGRGATAKAESGPGPRRGYRGRDREETKARRAICCRSPADTHHSLNAARAATC
jgi:hypothetical protein